MAEGVVGNRLRAAFAGAVAPHGPGRLLEVMVEDAASFDDIRLQRVVLNEGAVAVQLAAAVRPSTFDLQQNYPNPFNPTTQIGYGLPEDGHVEIAIFNVVGQKIRTLVSEIASAGFQYIMWDGRSDAGYAVPSGMYFYVMQTEDFRKVKKAMLLK